MRLPHGIPDTPPQPFQLRIGLDNQAQAAYPSNGAVTQHCKIAKLHTKSPPTNDCSRPSQSERQCNG